MERIIAWLLCGFLTVICLKISIMVLKDSARDRSWLFGLLLPWYYLAGDPGEDIGNFTVFWGRGVIREIFGWIVITVLGPLRAALSLVSWIFLFILYCFLSAPAKKSTPAKKHA